jgi:3-methyl-2-oxobutanoate hydroxymethyltransferase
MIENLMGKGDGMQHPESQIMSHLSENSPAKATVKSIKKLKGVRPIVAITAYDAIFARYADPHVDMILVGDSVGNTMLGHNDTVAVTLDIMVHHSAAVARTNPTSMLVADIPFSLAYESTDKLISTARRLMQEGGVQAVKIEVGHESLFHKIEVLVAAGIPVIGHIGLLPQNIHALGSYRSYGNRETGKRRLTDWALQLQNAGCFCVLGEMIKAESAAEIAQALQVPFIGIGCGNQCDGQIIVIYDILGLSDPAPSFSKEFAQVGKQMDSAIETYANAVIGRQFPEK